MFKFDFDLDSLIDDGTSSDQTNSETNSSNPIQTLQTSIEPNPISSIEESGEIKLEELITSLPPFLSYSSIKIKTVSKDSIKTIWRRDLYDARYQTYLDPHETQSNSSTDQENKKTNLIQNEKLNNPLRFKSKNQDIQSLLNAPSDLISGIYEGGFKTWESSLDLIEYFSNHQIILNLSNQFKSNINEKRKKSIKVLEIGCGTGLPSVWLLFKLFYDLLLFRKLNLHDHQRNQNDIPNDQPILEVHLQDFNSEVLYLLTFPNIILAFHRANQLVSSHHSNDTRLIEEDESGDIEVTPELVNNFLNLLQQHQIHLCFFHGPWHSFLLNPSSPNQYDLSFSSETIYSPSTLLSLVNLFQRINSSTLLVAAKSVYFGVGGSSFEFIKLCENKGGEVMIIWSTDQLDHREVLGVNRVIMDVKWPIITQ